MIICGVSSDSPSTLPKNDDSPTASSLSFGKTDLMTEVYEEKLFIFFTKLNFRKSNSRFFRNTKSIPRLMGQYRHYQQGMESEC